MTLVVGCRTIDGVLMAADCRVVKNTPTRRIAADCAQKTVRIGESSVIGFAGDVNTIAYLLGHLLGLQPKRRRTDPVSLRHWLPRFLRATYAALARDYPDEIRECSFLVGSTIAGRQQRLELAEIFRFRPPPGYNNILVLRAMNDLLAGRDHAYLAGSSEGLLYEVRSPHFIAQDVPAFSWRAIGSAAVHAREVMLRYEGLIYTAEPKLALGWFMEAVASIMSEAPDDGIGGLFLVSALCDGEVGAMLSSGSKSTGERIVAESDHFVQIHGARKIRLYYPGELSRSADLLTQEMFEPYRKWPSPLPFEGRTLPAFLPAAVHERLRKEGLFD